MQTLVPIGTFETKALKLLGEAGFEHLLESIARRPRAGRIIQGTGGLRKVRIARPGRGKSGSARVIYYYHNEHKPIMWAKQENLTADQKAQLKKHVDKIIAEFG